MFSARFVVLEVCRSDSVGSFIPMDLSADLMTRCSLWMSCLVAELPHTVMDFMSTVTSVHAGLCTYEVMVKTSADSDAVPL